MIYITMKNYLLSLSKTLGFNQSEMGSYLGIEQGSYSDIERGKVGLSERNRKVIDFVRMRIVRRFVYKKSMD